MIQSRIIPPGKVWVVIFLLVVAANLPYVVGYLNAPEAGAFTGNAFAQTRVDYNSQLARMQNGLRGQWRLTLLFTPEEHSPQWVQPFYTTLGQIARVTGLSLGLVYHLARVGTMVLMWWVIWQFVAHYLPDDFTRWWAFLMASVVGGAGWLLYLIMPAQTATLAPIEFWLLDAYTLLAALTFPHFCVTVAALVGYVLLLERWLAAPDWRGVGWLVLVSVVFGFVQPFDLLLTALLTALGGLLALARRRVTLTALLRLTPVAAVHLAIVAYYALAFRSDPVWAAFTAQNITLSPPPIYYLFAYAWFLIAAGIGLWQVWAARRRDLVLPVAWVLLVILLLYAPLQMQRRFLMGVQVPLALLAALGLGWLRGRWLAPRPGRVRLRRVKQWRLLTTAGVLLASLTHLLFILSGAISANPQDRPLLFLSDDTLAAQAWLREQPLDVVVFSTFEAGGEIAGFTGRRVYIGHWIETMDFEQREAQVAAFFASDGMTDHERLALLVDAGLDYVWVDETARALGDWSPEQAAFLRLAFETDTVTVFEVVP